MADPVQQQQRAEKRAEALRKNLQRRKSRKNEQNFPAPKPEGKDHGRP